MCNGGTERTKRQHVQDMSGKDNEQESSRVNSETQKHRNSETHISPKGKEESNGKSSSRGSGSFIQDPRAMSFCVRCVLSGSQLGRMVKQPRPEEAGNEHMTDTANGTPNFSVILPGKCNCKCGFCFWEYAQLPSNWL